MGFSRTGEAITNRYNKALALLIKTQKVKEEQGVLTCVVNHSPIDTSIPIGSANSINDTHVDKASFKSESEFNQTLVARKTESKTPTKKRLKALDEAKDYLRNSALSQKGLTEQLEYDTISNSDAVYGVENCKANWDNQVTAAVKEYISASPFSRAGLIKQLEHDGFTHEQAEYGVSRISIDYVQQAELSARQYLENFSFSFKGLIKQLEYEGFSRSEAEDAARRLGNIWTDQAVKSAKEYNSDRSYTREELIEQLEYDGFSHEQAVNGVKSMR